MAVTRRCASTVDARNVGNGGGEPDEVARSGGASASPWPARAAFGVVLALHAGLISYFAPPSIFTSGDFLLDYGQHPEQIVDALRSLESSGRAWAYDPHRLAGRLVGVADDPATRGIVLLALGLHRLGPSVEASLNSIVFSLHLVVPLVAWLSARAFRASPGAAVVTAALAVAAWYFDSFLHWTWFAGFYGWSAAALLVPLVLATAYGAATRGSWGLGGAFLVSMTLLGVVMPQAAIVALFGVYSCVVVAGRGGDRRGPRIAIGLSLAIAAIVAGGAASMGWRVSGATMAGTLSPTLEYVLYDAFDLLRDVRNTGSPVRTAVRVLTFAAAALALHGFRKARDDRFWPFTSYLGAALCLAYLGGYVPGIDETQPYGHVGGATMTAAIAAGVAMTRLAEARHRALLGKTAAVPFALLLVISVPRIVRTALYYVPSVLPEPVRYWKLELNSSALIGMNEPKPLAMSHVRPPEHYAEVTRWLDRNHGGRGRVFVREWGLAQYAIVRTKLPIIGGPLDRMPDGNRAHLFARATDGNLAGSALVAYLERYSVGWVVLSGGDVALDHRSDVLELAAVVSGHRVYRTKITPSLVERGRAVVTEASLDRIAVEQAEGRELVLRFHYVDGLVCRPGCRVDPSASGFIRIEDPPAELVVELAR